MHEADTYQYEDFLAEAESKWPALLAEGRVNCEFNQLNWAHEGWYQKYLRPKGQPVTRRKGMLTSRVLRRLIIDWYYDNKPN